MKIRTRRVKREPAALAAHLTARVFMAALLALAAGCNSGTGEQAAAPPIVTVAQPAIGPVTDYIDFTGNTVATAAVTLGGPRRRLSRKNSFYRWLVR